MSRFGGGWKFAARDNEAVMLCSVLVDVQGSTGDCWAGQWREQALRWSIAVFNEPPVRAGRFT